MHPITRRQFLVGSAGVVVSAVAASSAVTFLRRASPPVEADRPVSFTLVDHHNLRDVESRIEASWQQVDAIKRGIDQAVALGIGSYVLFAGRTFEAMLPYDFELPGVGNLSQALPVSDKERRNAEGLRACLAEAIHYADARNVRLLFHTNQFEAPNALYEIVGDRLRGATGTPICPGREDTWRIYRGKVETFCQLFPGLDGLQVTADESDVTILDCHCSYCQHLDPLARINLLTDETARAVGQREAQLRTWQSLAGMDGYDPREMTASLPANVTLSLKSTRGDFMLESPFDDALVGAGDAARQMIEFDAWGEYNGHNILPCYMGDIWASQIRTCAERGIRQYAVRMNWNSAQYPLFERPWANLVNLHSMLALARLPDARPDDVLRQFIRDHYPARAAEAAFAFYKATPEFMRAIYYVDGAYLAHHSRMLKTVDTTREAYASLQHLFPAPADFERQRQRVEVAYQSLAARIAALPDLPSDWREEMERAARSMRYVGLGLVNQLEAVSEYRHDPALRERILTAEAEWQALDSASFDHMRGEMPRAALDS